MMVVANELKGINFKVKIMNNNKKSAKTILFIQIAYKNGWFRIYC